MPELTVEQAIQQRTAEKMRAALGRHEKLEKQAEDPNSTQWRGQPPRPTDIPAGVRSNSWEIPLADDINAVARNSPELLEGYFPDDTMRDYKLPASREWYGVRAAL